MTFTIEQLEEMRSKITPGDRYLHEDDWGDLCVVNDDGRYMNWGDQLVVKIEAGHPEHDGESIVAIPKLISALIAEKQAHAKLREEIEALRDLPPMITERMYDGYLSSWMRDYPADLTRILEGHNE
ncbi:hypothetical protein [Corynebacterium callunae]|uniref:hypothetical protein n=1 Tax=Corynebacterium callunae TaxID=1721 RepID=UPI002000078B|nr:hypothetical protein [Corynebacterium callunae]MCK2200501.1 hypothetical protein [Corynebacterium callunae]